MNLYSQLLAVILNNWVKLLYYIDFVLALCEILDKLLWKWIYHSKLKYAYFIAKYFLSILV